MTEPRVVLRLDEAVDLGHAWMQALADVRGIRVLFIKGPALHRHGLRDERVSADVDLLVEPVRFAEFCQAVLEVGWTTRPGNFISHRTTLHSETFLREGWPCDLDVHGFFPGFLAPPADVFDALWARRVRMEFAHVECDVPDRVGGALILALHSLRGASIQARHADELEQLTRVVLTEDERIQVADLALATGCAATLASVLPRLGVPVEAPVAELASRGLREWRERVDSGSHGAYFWMLALRRAPWWEKPAVLWRAFWPSGAELRVAHPEIDGTLRSAMRARWARWVHGVTSAPKAMHAIFSNRRRR
ncbi:hypothetical protein [Microbacterium terregens]|uniref:Nucleotidyltransferase family protein n=1 Tax=Microbacterium terregens TaxID=69363 RepID=A0ABV5T3K3_9MICO